MKLLNYNLSRSETGYSYIFYLFLHSIVNALIISTTAKFSYDSLLGLFFAPFFASLIGMISIQIMKSLFKIEKYNSIIFVVYTIVLIESITYLFVDETYLSIIINDVPYRNFYRNLPNILLLYNNYVSLILAIVIVKIIVRKVGTKKPAANSGLAQ